MCPTVQCPEGPGACRHSDSNYKCSGGGSGEFGDGGCKNVCPILNIKLRTKSKV